MKKQEWFFTIAGLTGVVTGTYLMFSGSYFWGLLYIIVGIYVYKPS